MSPRLLLLLFIVGLVGCAATATPSDPARQPAARAVGTRYAVQWHGCIGEQAGVAVRPHLAFVDRFEPGAHRRDPTFDDVTLIGDGGGAVPARVALVGVGFEDDTYRAVNVDLEVAGLGPGTHRFTAVRYRDEGGRQRQVSIGTYVVEIVHRQANDLSIWQADVGSSRFGRLSVELQNDREDPVRVEGLRFALPDLPLRTAMRAVAAATATASGAPVAASSGEPVRSVELAAGERRMLEFEFSGADPLTFVLLQPIVRYVRADGSAGLLPLVPHRYAPGFTSPSEVEQFLSAVPEDGIHALSGSVP